MTNVSWRNATILTIGCRLTSTLRNVHAPSTRRLPVLLSLAMMCFLSPWRGSSVALTNGNNDADTLEANVVVKLIGSNCGICSGTLISPVAVLTAKDCITGDNFSNQNIFGGNGGKSGLTLPITVCIGNLRLQQSASLGTCPQASDPRRSPTVFGDNGPVNDQRAWF